MSLFSMYVLVDVRFYICLLFFFFKQKTAYETLAQKAIAAGFAGEQVDGNDVIAVRAAAAEAIAAARSGEGPRFIEALTYRLGDHTTADDAARYRPPQEVQTHWKEEPIARLR